jgi:tetratricopeptide (TPR) repeat protein
MAASFSLVPSR